MKRYWRGGQEVGQGISEVFKGIGVALNQGVEGISWLGDQIVTTYATKVYEVAESLYKVGKKYLYESQSLDSQWGSLNQYLNNDSTTVIRNWVISLGHLNKLWTLIKLPWTIIMTLQKVEINTKRARPPKGDTYVWTKNGGENEKICWECFWVVLKRPRKSLNELRKMVGGTWKINPTTPEQ